MARIVDIGTLQPGDLCLMDGGKIAKVVAHAGDVPVNQRYTRFEDERGRVDWVWSNYKVTVD